MIFQKSPSKIELANEDLYEQEQAAGAADEVETVVGPSVNVEGDFSSEGNIIVKGSVSGSVHTSKYLSVEPGAKIMANVRAGSAKISGEVKGNVKVKDLLELTSSAKVIGDIEVKTLVIEAGAILYGKVVMPGVEVEGKTVGRGRAGNRKLEEQMMSE